MTFKDQPILVIGATGQQGGAVARQLLQHGRKVRALVRRPDQAPVQALRQQGAEIVQGDLDQPESVREAMKGVYGVFSVQAFHLDELEREVRHGQTAADAAKAAGVSHLIYSSAAGADRGTGITSFENKGIVERYIRSLSIPATFLRPVMFMDNFRPLLQAGHGEILLPYMGAPDTRVQMIAVRDIGAFAALAFDRPDAYTGKAIELAGDEVSLREIGETLRSVTGLSVQAQTPPANSQQIHEHDGLRATAFFAREGYKADIASLRRMYPQLLDFEAWLRLAYASL